MATKEKNPMTKDDLKAVLLALEDAGGRLTAEGVLDAARDEAHPLHGEFEWDDSVAAEQHRLSQARKLLQVRMEVVVNERTFEVPLYVRDPDAEYDTQGYRARRGLADDPLCSQAVIRHEVVMLMAWLKRVRDLAETFGLWPEVEGHARVVEGAVARIAEVLSPPAPVCVANHGGDVA